MTIMPHMPPGVYIASPWQKRLAEIVEMVREMSTHTDPQAMVRAYAARVRPLVRADGFVSLSRRSLEPPKYRITRSWKFAEPIDPWREPHRLPMFDSGILGELLYSGEARMIPDFHVPAGDPAYEHLVGARSIAMIPQYDGGTVVNAVLQIWTTPNGLDPERFPELVWMANLFGRATSTLVLSRNLEEANRVIEAEIQTVADIQRSLLPVAAPTSSFVKFATHYRASRHAGGDYYDFFPLRDGKIGVLIADVSGHGAPAAVLMAIVHAIAHLSCEGVDSPACLLDFVNAKLAERYTIPAASFVTAFYAVFDPAASTMRYAVAGHPPPIVRRASAAATEMLDVSSASIPIGIMTDIKYDEQTITLSTGDLIAFYTDGINETRRAQGEFFGTHRIAQAVDSAADEHDAVNRTLRALSDFDDDSPAVDDRTLVVARIL